MITTIPLDDLPRELDTLYALHDDLRGQLDALSDRLFVVEVRISEIENSDDDWTAYRECVTGEWRRSEI